MNTRPEYLRRSDAVAMVSPSYATPMENVEKTEEVLRLWGLEPVRGKHVGTVYAGQYAGTPEERAEDFLDALLDPSIKAILCNRGGYGALHLIERIPPEVIAANPKWLIGYSDISTLHALFTCSGVMSIHAPMSSSIWGMAANDSAMRLRELLFGTPPSYELPPHPCSIQGCAEGVLVGGNLCTITPLLGTVADSLHGKDIVLFIEDVEESWHNLDRQFNILRLSGVLDCCRAVVFGEFTDCGQEFKFPSVEAMLTPYLKEYGIPVLCGFPAGHGETNLPLVMGAPVRVEVGKDSQSLTTLLDL